MNNLKVIKSTEQYYMYCDELERLTSLKELSEENEDKIELLTVLIEKWDEDHSTPESIHPVDMLIQLMEMHEINAIRLSQNTGINKTVLSKILHYKKGFSKEVIRSLSDYFKVNQAAFNKPYNLAEKDLEDLKKFKGPVSAR